MQPPTYKRSLLFSQRSKQGLIELSCISAFSVLFALDVWGLDWAYRCLSRIRRPTFGRDSGFTLQRGWYQIRRKDVTSRYRIANSNIQVALLPTGPGISYTIWGIDLVDRSQSLCFAWACPLAFLDFAIDLRAKLFVNHRIIMPRLGYWLSVRNDKLHKGTPTLDRGMSRNTPAQLFAKRT